MVTKGANRIIGLFVIIILIISGFWLLAQKIFNQGQQPARSTQDRTIMTGRLSPQPRTFVS